MNAKQILTILGEGFLSEVGAAIGKDLYHQVKEFLLSRPKSEQKALIAETSFRRPDAFMAFEIDRISQQAASYLLSLPASERRSIIEMARKETAKDNEQILFNLIRIIQTRS